jgi:hypothetical protein
MALLNLPLRIRKWAAFGTGVGIEIGPLHLHVHVSRVRPSGAVTLGSIVIENYRERPAAEWGREYAEFLKRFGVGHIAAAVLVPRSELVVRTIALPGVGDDELGAAVSFQLDTMHPYAEDDAVGAWARLDPVNVLVSVMRRQLFEKYQALFVEAGVKVSTFTFSAAVIYSALRLNTDPPKEFLAALDTSDSLEIYGESPARPVFSATFDLARERAIPMAAAELRLSPQIEPIVLDTGLAHLAAQTSACPSMSLPANLLPEAERRSSSRVRYIPTAVLALLLATIGTGILLHPPYDAKRYVRTLEYELQRVEPMASRVSKLDQQTEKTRARVKLLDDFRRRTKQDMDLVLDLTNMLPPPTFAGYVEITRDNVQVAGEADQAAPLLRVLDASPRIQNSEFVTPIARVANGETFQIRGQREGVSGK